MVVTHHLNSQGNSPSVSLKCGKVYQWLTNWEPKVGIILNLKIQLITYLLKNRGQALAAVNTAKPTSNSHPEEPRLSVVSKHKAQCDMQATHCLKIRGQAYQKMQNTTKHNNNSHPGGPKARCCQQAQNIMRHASYLHSIKIGRCYQQAENEYSKHIYSPRDR